MTFIKKFESFRKKFIGADTSDVDGKIAVQVNLTDEDCGGAFYIEAEKGMLNVEPYDYHDNTAMITLSAEDFEALADKNAELSELCTRGRVIIDGDFSHAEKIFALAANMKPKRTARAAKKPAAKSDEKSAATAEAAKPVKKSSEKKDKTSAVSNKASASKKKSKKDVK